jgi:hypothetical protein
MISAGAPFFSLSDQIAVNFNIIDDPALHSLLLYHTCPTCSYLILVLVLVLVLILILILIPPLSQLSPPRGTHSVVCTSALRGTHCKHKRAKHRGTTDFFMVTITAPLLLNGIGTDMDMDIAWYGLMKDSTLVANLVPVGLPSPLAVCAHTSRCPLSPSLPPFSPFFLSNKKNSACHHPEEQTGRGRTLVSVHTCFHNSSHVHVPCMQPLCFSHSLAMVAPQPFHSLVHTHAAVSETQADGQSD